MLSKGITVGLNLQWYDFFWFEFISGSLLNEWRLELKAVVSGRRLPSVQHTPALVFPSQPTCSSSAEFG